MKLWFTSDNVDWDGARYRYAAEQMLLTLFPGERPEYPDTPAPTALNAQSNAVIFTLHRGKKLTNLSALLLREHTWHNGVVRFPSQALDQPPEAVYHTVQHALKQAFYKAGTGFLGHDLPWGSLTGVRPVKLPTRALLEGKTPAGAAGLLEKEYHVSPRRAKLAVACAWASVELLSELRPEEVSLYVGIPFCPSRCAYCSFVSADVSRCLPLVEPFLDALAQEATAAGHNLSKNGRRVRTLYMGGGTPTTLTAGQLDRLLTALEKSLELSTCAERTVEAGRPDTITREKLAVLAGHGVGRISINPQTMQDQVLSAMGRDHRRSDILRAYADARSAGTFCINMDLIAGLPLDTPEGFRASLEQVLALSPENITVHTLALKKGSRLMEEGGALPGAEAVAAMLDFAWDALEAAGYRPYYLYRQKYMSGGFENIGWCRPGTQSAYNIIMMEELHSVLALGGGGMTKLLPADRSSILRINNPKYPREYLERIDDLCAEKENLTWPTN